MREELWVLDIVSICDGLLNLRQLGYLVEPEHQRLDLRLHRVRIVYQVACRNAVMGRRLLYTDEAQSMRIGILRDLFQTQNITSDLKALIIIDWGHLIEVNLNTSERVSDSRVCFVLNLHLFQPLFEVLDRDRGFCRKLRFRSLAVIGIPVHDGVHVLNFMGFGWLYAEVPLKVSDLVRLNLVHSG